MEDRIINSKEVILSLQQERPDDNSVTFVNNIHSIYKQEET